MGSKSPYKHEKRTLKERPFCFTVLLSGFSISRLRLVRRGLAVGRGLAFALRVLSLCIAVIIRCIAVQNSLHVSRQIVLGVIIGDRSLRLTLGEQNTEEDVDYIIETVTDVVKTLRSMSPVWENGHPNLTAATELHAH